MTPFMPFMPFMRLNLFAPNLERGLIACLDLALRLRSFLDLLRFR